MSDLWEGSKEQGEFYKRQLDAVLDVLIAAGMWDGAEQYRGKSVAELVQILVERSKSPVPPRPKRIPIRPIANTSGGKFNAELEVDTLKQIVRQLTDYVNELRRDVDTLQGYGD